MKKGLDARRGGSNGGKRRKRSLLASIGSVIATLFCVIMVLYASAITTLVGKLYEQRERNKNSGPSNQQQISPLSQQRQRAAAAVATTTSQEHRTYKEWRKLAVELAQLPAAEALDRLDKEDPFGVRSFHQKLIDMESERKAILNMEEVKSLFACPANDRITLPDQRDNAKAKAFREGKPGTFLFFQHLRKAGGTNFCTLAKSNLPESAVSKYYCMGDWFWVHDDGTKAVGAGYLMHWTNDEIVKHMTADGHRVIGNEWDLFDRNHHFDLPALLATSFRRPMDRALSQFRFECIEDRGCKIKDVGEWWEKRKDLYNIYTRTFATVGITRKLVKGAFEGNTPEDATERGEMLGDALDTVIKFHLVLTMEWLAYAKPKVEQVLGFMDTTPLTTRIRPHIGQAKREDGQEVNKLGAAGIAKASWTPEDYLNPAQYEAFRLHLALDDILTDAARRIFLERLVCDDIDP